MPIPWHGVCSTRAVAWSSALARPGIDGRAARDEDMGLCAAGCALCRQIDVMSLCSVTGIDRAYARMRASGRAPDRPEHHDTDARPADRETGRLRRQVPRRRLPIVSRIHQQLFHVPPGPVRAQAGGDRGAAHTFGPQALDLGRLSRPRRALHGTAQPGGIANHPLGGRLDAHPRVHEREPVRQRLRRPDTGFGQLAPLGNTTAACVKPFA